jgi:hypothetical protein
VGEDTTNVAGGVASMLASFFFATAWLAPAVGKIALIRITNAQHLIFLPSSFHIIKRFRFQFPSLNARS